MSSLKDLKGMGGLVPDAPVKREIKFKLDGVDYTASIFVKVLGIGAYEEKLIGADDKKSRTAQLISETITLGEEGKERITFEQAYTLRPALAGAMVKAFNEVNAEKKP